jgi:opacity protein-like surface antigen
MKKYFFLIAMWSALFFNSNAQKNKMEYGFSSGINLNSGYGNQALRKIGSTIAGLHVSGHFKVGINEHLALKAVLAYDQNGYIYRSLTFSNAAGNGLETGDLQEKLNYLNLPLLAEYTFGKKIKFYAGGGVFAGYLLKYTTITKIKDPVAYNTRSSTDRRKKLNFGLCAEAGVQFPVNATIKLKLGVSNNLGLANIYKPVSSSDNSVIKTNAFAVLTGITVSLK